MFFFGVCASYDLPEDFHSMCFPMREKLVERSPAILFSLPGLLVTFLFPMTFVARFIVDGYHAQTIQQKLILLPLAFFTYIAAHVTSFMFFSVSIAVFKI